MSDLDLGKTIKIGEFEADLRLDFWFCPNHGILIPSRFEEEWNDEEGCPVLMADEESCGQTLRSVNLADWQYAKVRIEVNRKGFSIPKKATSGRALRELAGIPEGEDLYGKGPAHPERELTGPGGEGYLLAPGQLFEPQEGMEFYSIPKDRPSFFAGIPIDVDPDLAPDRIKIITGAGLERIYQFDGEHLDEITI